MEAEKTSKIVPSVKPIFEKFSQSRDVKLVFGEPVEVENKKVVPVAKVNYFFGGGGGVTDGTDKTPAAEGGGGGGHISVSPLGVYEITPIRTTYKPTYDLKFVMVMMAIMTLGLALFFRKTRKE